MRVAFITKPFQVELLGIAYLAAVLKKEGHSPKLFNTCDQGCLEKLRNFKPEILAYSVTTGQHKFFLQENMWLKILFPKAKSVFGGPHPTYFPEFRNEPGVDYIVRGEAENSFPALLNILRDGYTMATDKEVHPYPLIKDLDTIPFPDREFLYEDPKNYNNPIKDVITSRGCPYSCPYCFNSIYRDMYKEQPWLRYRSPDNVIKECLELKNNYPLKMIFFQDDEFLMNPRLEELLIAYHDKVRVPFHIQLRVEHLTEVKVLMLKTAGCYSVTFAIESGDPLLRVGMLKRNITTGQILQGADLLKRYGILFRTENMIGLPGETMTQMFKTVTLNQMVRPTIGWCSLFQPYPNLPLSKYAKAKGYWDGNMDMKESFFEKSVLNFTNKEEIENLQKLFGPIVHYQIPLWIVKILIRLRLFTLYQWIFKSFKGKQYRKLYGLTKEEK